ncbi:MAG: hypothetical protein ACP5NC_04145 [Nitrososphaeria archaeon]
MQGRAGRRGSGIRGCLFEVKALKNHLDADTLERLKKVFVEAKWFTNSVIAGAYSMSATKPCWSIPYVTSSLINKAGSTQF